MTVLVRGVLFDQGASDDLHAHERTPNTGPDPSTLHGAAAIGDLIRLGQAATRASDLECRDQDGWTALHLAAAAGHYHAVEALLELGARPDTRSGCPGGFDGCTALHLAVIGGHLQASERLLRAGADPDAREECGFTPLHLAADRGHRALVRLLLKAGARVNATVCDHTALGLARRGRHMEVAALLKMVGGTL